MTTMIFGISCPLQVTYTKCFSLHEFRPVLLFHAAAHPGRGAGAGAQSSPASTTRQQHFFLLHQLPTFVSSFPSATLSYTELLLFC